MRAGVVLLVAAGLAGCAAGYSRTMGQSLGRVQSRDWEGALASLDKPSGDTNMLLYRLEKGLVLHYAGDYTGSNGQFEKAEKLIDRHYTRSISREVAALASALERSSRSIAARMQAFAGLDPANPHTPANKATALTQSVWAEYLADRTAIAVEGQRAYLGILNRYSMGRP